MSYNSVEDYVKNAENNRNTAVLNSLLESEPGMKELPEITSEDEGKILQVNNGSPAWSGSSSGGGALKIGVTATQGGDQTIIYTLDKTWKQIVDTVNGGIIPYICMDIEGGKAVRILAGYSFDGVDYHVDFNYVFTTTSENGYPSYIDGSK